MKTLQDRFWRASYLHWKLFTSSYLSFICKRLLRGWSSVLVLVFFVQYFDMSEHKLQCWDHLILHVSGGYFGRKITHFSTLKRRFIFKRPCTRGAVTATTPGVCTAFYYMSKIIKKFGESIILLDSQQKFFSRILHLTCLFCRRFHFLPCHVKHLEYFFFRLKHWLWSILFPIIYEMWFNFGLIHVLGGVKNIQLCVKIIFPKRVIFDSISQKYQRVRRAATW